MGDDCGAHLDCRGGFWYWWERIVMRRGDDFIGRARGGVCGYELVLVELLLVELFLL